ncbi:hypothetical protein ACFLZU_01990 [Thermodesulfobacteriota bacterium]
MKLIPASPRDNRVKGLSDGLWQALVLSLLALTLLCFSTESHSAQITFAQNGLTVNVAPGETVAVPITVSLEDTSLPNSYASFGLAHVGGTLDRSWINNQIYMSLNSWYKTRQAVLQVKVPAGAQGGNYKGILKTVWLRSNESVAPAEFEINVDVDSFVSCSQVPLFSDIVSSQESINMRNNKPVQIELSGTVSVPDGCEIYNAQYQLTDEYGELDRVEALQLGDDGSFTVAILMVASRKGNDKDGRLYTVKFEAENEAGVGESVETNIVVMHDNGKK